MKIINYSLTTKNTIKLSEQLKIIIGLKQNTIKKILCSNYLSKNTKFAKINRTEQFKIYKYLTNYINKNKILNIKNIKKQNIEKKRGKKNYQGLRHINTLPVRGQNTKNNAKTQRGKIKKKKSKERKNKNWKLI